MSGRQIAQHLIATERRERTGILDLGCLGLTEIPSEVFELSHLRSLNLGRGYYDDEYEYHVSDWLKQANTICVIPEAIKKLKALVQLSITGLPIVNLRHLCDLSLLTRLDCSDTKVVSFSFLEGLALEDLFCSGRFLTTKHLKPLGKLTSLKRLNISNSQVDDLRPIQRLDSLSALYIEGTKVSSLTPLSDLKALQELDISETLISDLSPLRKLVSLKKLSCRSTPVYSLKPLSGLKSLEYLCCAETPVLDLSPLSAITSLVHLWFDKTKVTDLTPLAGLIALESLGCSETSGIDLKPLLNLPKLRIVKANSCCFRGYCSPDWRDYEHDKTIQALVQKATLESLNLHQSEGAGVPWQFCSPSSGYYNFPCIDELRAYFRFKKTLNQLDRNKPVPQKDLIACLENIRTVFHC